MKFAYWRKRTIRGIVFSSFRKIENSAKYIARSITGRPEGSRTVLHLKTCTRKTPEWTCTTGATSCLKYKLVPPLASFSRTLLSPRPFLFLFFLFFLFFFFPTSSSMQRRQRPRNETLIEDRFDIFPAANSYCEFMYHFVCVRVCVYFVYTVVGFSFVISFFCFKQRRRGR